MKKYIPIIVIAGLIILVASYFVFRDIAPEEPKDLGGTTDDTTDIVGSRTGTSTTGVLFGDVYNGGIIATTTYIKKTSRRIDQATFTLMALSSASSTPSGTNNFQFFGSNDGDCDTATTSQDVGNPVLMADINWYDIGDHRSGAAYPVSPTTASTTIDWSPTIEIRRDFVFDRLDYECLRLDVIPAGASSTLLYIGLITE